MAIKTKKVKTEAEQQAAKAEKAKSQSELRSDDIRAKALSSFHPSVVDWFKEKLGVDLRSNQVSVSDLYKLGRGEFTSPVKVVVTPLVYDSSKKVNVSMPSIQSVVSIRASLPSYQGKPVAIDDKHQPFIQTVACRPLVELAAPGEEMSKGTEAAEDKRETKFTESQVMALEGIGITRERLYGGFNRLSRAEKLDILDGEVFAVEGSVKTDFGYVNVSGEARLQSGADGTAKAVFEPSYPDKRAEGLIVDIDRARVIGNLELDLFERTPDNKLKTDANGDRILNQAGRNILDYGVSLEPVKGYLHKRTRSSDGSWKDTVEVSHYTVRAINGSFFAQKLNEKEVLGEDGKKTGVTFELPNVRMKDDKVYVNGQNKPLAFASSADRESFLQGRGGVVEGATFVDFKTKKSVVYDAFVFCNESGFAEKFSPATSEKIIASRKASETRKQSVSTRRKVRFGVGL